VPRDARGELEARLRRTARKGRLGGGGNAVTALNVPKLFNLRSDPFERADQSIFYRQWSIDRQFMLVTAQGLLGKWLESFKEFPPRARAASYSIDQIVEKMMSNG
jgi:arylsulfatase